jgi:hypothetical protein
MYCCIIGVSFSAGLFLTAAALISFGTVVIGSSGDAISLVLRERKSPPRVTRHFTAFGCWLTNSHKRGAGCHEQMCRKERKMN